MKGDESRALSEELHVVSLGEQLLGVVAGATEEGLDLESSREPSRSLEQES